MSACECCGAAVLDAPVCTGCARRLELNLGDVPALVAELETVLARLTAYDTRPQRVTGNAETLVPFSTPAGDARQHLHAILSTWCRLVYREKHQPRTDPRPLPADRPSAMAGWLLHETEWIRHHTQAANAIDEITDATRRVRHILDAPRNRATFHVGPCPELGCHGEVRAYIPRDETVMAHADCTANPDHAWDPTQWLRLGKRMLRLEVTS